MAVERKHWRGDRSTSEDGEKILTEERTEGRSHGKDEARTGRGTLISALCEGKFNFLLGATPNRELMVFDDITSGILALILKELKIMNIHLTNITGDELKRSDIDA